MPFVFAYYFNLLQQKYWNMEKGNWDLEVLMENKAYDKVWCLQPLEIRKIYWFYILCFFNPIFFILASFLLNDCGECICLFPCLLHCSFIISNKAFNR